jgi:uncharacterized protein (TIGR00156 family)
MHKLWYTLPIALLFAAGTAGAQMGKEQKPMQSPQGKSAATDSAPITTAQGVASAKDDQKVQLRGKITGQQGKNEYLFSDRTGNVVVEIGSKALKEGQKLVTGTEVEIQGEVDTRKGKSPKVEAKQVTILAATGGGAAPGSTGSSGPMREPSSPSSPPSRQPGSPGGSPSPSPAR